MNFFYKLIATSLALSFGVFVLAYPSRHIAQSDAEAEIKFKTSQWLQLWSPGDNPMTFEGIEDIFATKEHGLLVVDGFEGGAVVLKSIPEYKEKWMPLMNETFSYYKIKVKGDIQIEASKRLATTTFVWETENALLKDGSEVSISQYATHIWKKINGEWKIIHEHLTNRTEAEEGTSSPEEQIEELSRQWIEEGFSPKEDTQDYTYENYLEPWYAIEGDVVFHDNNDPQMCISKDAEEYAEIWEDAFKATEFIDNELTEIHQIEVNGDLALSSFTADAIVTPNGGEQVRMPVFYSLGWKKTAEGWKIIHEHGSVLASSSAVQDAAGGLGGSDIETFIEDWGKAWSPREQVADFTMKRLAPFYIQDESLLAFDFTDAEQKTVIHGYQDHFDMWGPFIPAFKFWTFTPVEGSLSIHEFGEGAGVTIYVDNFGIRPDGSEFHARAHVTLVLKRVDGDWKIVHENIWGPVREEE